MEKRQWQRGEDLPERKTNPSKVVDHETGIDVGNITGNELDNAIKHMKRNKAPGPDRVISELYKWLDMDSRDMLREILNECWEEEEVPKVLLEANVASIYKKMGSAEFGELQTDFASEWCVQNVGGNYPKDNFK